MIVREHIVFVFAPVSLVSGKSITKSEVLKLSFRFLCRVSMYIFLNLAIVILIN